MPKVNIDVPGEEGGREGLWLPERVPPYGFDVLVSTGRKQHAEYRSREDGNEEAGVAQAVGSRICLDKTAGYTAICSLQRKPTRQEGNGQTLKPCAIQFTGSEHSISGVAESRVPWRPYPQVSSVGSFK